MLVIYIFYFCLYHLRLVPNCTAQHYWEDHSQNLQTTRNYWNSDKYGACFIFFNEDREIYILTFNLQVHISYQVLPKPLQFLLLPQQQWECSVRTKRSLCLSNPVKWKTTKLSIAVVQYWISWIVSGEGVGVGGYLVFSLATSIIIPWYKEGRTLLVLYPWYWYDIQLMYNIQISYYIDIKGGRILNFEHMVLVQYRTLAK